MRIHGPAVRALRELHGWSLSDLQTEVSAIRGGDRPVALSYLSELEHGHKPGSPRMAMLLAQALRCPIAAIVVGDDDREAA